MGIRVCAVREMKGERWGSSELERKQILVAVEIVLVTTNNVRQEDLVHYSTCQMSP